MSVTPKVQFDDEGLPIPPKQKIDFDDEGLPVPPKVKVPKGAGLDFISRVKDIAVKLISQGRGGELPSEPLVRTAGPVEEKIEVDEEVKLDPNDLVGSFKKNLKPLVKTATPTSDATYVKPSAQAVFNEQERQRPEVIKNLEREKKYKDLKNAFLTDQNLSTTQLMRATGLSAQQIQSASRADLDKMIRPENETDRLAAQVIADTKDVRTAFSNSRSLPEAAIRFAALKDPQVARQIEITSSKLPAKNLGEVVTGTKDVMADPKSIFGEATIGRMIYQLATNPIAVKEIDRNPELKKAFRETVPTLINKYPDFGKAYLGNMISQKMEDMGMNNALLNVVTKEETDKVVESLASEGKMTPNEVQFYKDNMREGGVRNFAKSLLSEQLYKTTGLVERALESAVGAVKATGTGIAEVTGARKALVGERAMTARDIGAGDIAVNVKPRTTISEITSYGGDFLGQVLPTGLIGKGLVATKAFKNPDTAIKALFGLQAYGNYIPQARAMFPGEEVKQRAYAGILAGLEIATENIFRDRKVVEGLLGKVKPEVASVIRQFTNKQISAAAAQEAVEGTIKKALQSVPQYTKYFGKGVGQNTVEETAVQLGQQLTDGVFTGKKFDDWVNGEELLETARTSALGSIFIAGLSARADALRAKGMTAKMIYDMSEKPDYWINAIREGATVDEDLANEAEDKISNLEYAAKVRQDLEKTNLTEKQKIKYLINALESNVKAKNSQAITDPVLKKRAEEEAKVIEQQQNDILNGVDQGEIEGDRSDEEVEAGEVAPEVPKAKAGMAMVRSINELKGEVELMKQGEDTPEKRAKIAEFEKEIAEQERLGIDPDKGRVVSVEVAEEVAPEVPQPVLKISTGKFADVEKADEAVSKIKELGIPNELNEKQVVIDGVKVEAVRDGGRILLKDISAIEPAKGSGTKVLNKIKEVADSNGVDIILTPTQIGDVSEADLIKWYKNNGFEDYTQGRLIYKAGEVAPEVPAAAPVPSIIEVKSPKEVKQGDTVVWRGEDFIVEEVNAKGGFNLRNVADRTNTVKDARITDTEFEGKRGEVVSKAKAEVPAKSTSDILASELLDILGTHEVVAGEVAPAEVFTKDNLDDISKEGLNDVQSKVVDDVKNVVKSISGLVENTTGNELKVTIHKDQDTYGDAVINAGGTKQDSSTKGFYLDADGTIHLNMARVTSETMLHEGFHPVLDFIAKNNPEVIDAFYAQLGKLDGGRAIINDAIEAYRGSDETTIKKEAITDFVAKVADGSFELNQSNFEKVKAFILDLIKKLGFDLRTDVKDINNVKELAKFISDKFSSGKEIMSKEFIPVKNDGEPGEVSGAGRLDAREISKAKVPGKNPLKFSKEKFKEVGLVSLPEVSLEEKAKEFNNKAIAINSDPTRVGELTLPSGKKIFMYGGLNYTALEPNVKGEIGFASTTLSKPKQVSGFIKSLFPETDGVGLVLTTSQKPESMLGNAYSLEYVLDAISQLPSKVLRSSDFRREFFGKDIVAVREAFGKKEYNEFVKKYGRADLGSPEVIQAMVEELLTDIGNNFIARNSLVSNMLAGVVEKSTRAATKGEKGFVSVTPNKFIAKVLFDNFGLNQEKLFNEIGEKGIVDAYMNEGKWGFITGGFESDSKVDYMSIQDKGVIHPQFNAKFHGKNPFLLDGAYMIDKLFKPELLEKNKKGEVYIDSKTGLPKPYEKKASLMVAGSMYPKGVIEVASPEFAKPIPQFSRPIELDVIEGFYSPIQKRILELKQPKASATKWKEIVGVKSDEAVFSGLADWLNSQKPDAQLSKQDVLNFMKDNRIEIKEVEKTGKQTVDGRLINERTGKVIYEGDEPTALNWLRNNSDINGKLIDGSNVNEYKFVRNELAPTKYSQYQLPGGENYKEVLITLPFKKSKSLPEGFYSERSRDGMYRVFDKEDTLVGQGKTEAEAISDALNEPETAASEVFKSSHFDEPNIISHLRMNTRTDADGKKVLFLEEVQSDWGQTGKRKGFKTVEKYPEISNYEIRPSSKGDISTYGYDIYGDGELIQEGLKDEVTANNYIEKYKQFDLNRNSTKVSPAPFVTNTNAWVKLGLKYALKEAVRQGADRIAWTTGEQQNERYDLSKQVGSIIYNKNANGTYDVSATRPEIVDISVDDAGANFLFNEYGIALKRIEDVFGKDVADKIFNNEGDVDDISGYTTLKGDNLKVGGKGMKAFYDKIVPDVAKSLVKELTGKQVEVGKAEIDVNERGKSTKDFDDLTSSLKFEKKLADEGKKGIVSTINKDGSYTIEWYEKKPTTQQSINITPELRQSVQGGMPQFSRDSQLLKIKDFVEAQKIKGVSDDVIREALYKVAGKIGLTKQEIDNLMAGEFPTKPKEYAVQEQAAGEVPVQPKAGVSEEVEGGVPPTEPPRPPKEGEGEGEEEEVTPGEMVGIKHESTEKMRTAYSLPEYDRPEGKTMLELEAEADKMIKDGYDVEALIKKLENAVPPSGVENIILAKYLGVLNADFDKTKNKETLAKIERVVDALDIIGTIQSEAFRTRKIMKPKEDTLAQYFIDEKADAGVDELTPEQEATITREYEEIKAAKEALQKKVEELQKENARLLAEGNIAELKKKVKKTRKTDADFRQERKNIADSIKEKLKKARNEQKVVVVPYAYELVSISPEVAKLVKSYVEQGIVNLADIVDGIHELLKEEIKDITKKDVQDIIAGEYRERKKTKNQLAAQVRDLKTEAKLLNEYEKLQQGEVPVKEEKKIERNRKLTELRNQIRESDVTKLAEAKESLNKRIAKIEKQLADGDFEKEPEKKKIKLDEEGRKLQAKLTKLKKERDVRRLKLQYEKQNKVQRTFNKVLEVFNVPRSLMASTDFSAPLNQALIATINYPKEAREAAIQMVKAAGSQEAFDNWFYDLKETPRYELMNKLKLGITDPFNPEITAREEAFMSGYAEQIPGLGKLVKGSERAYVQYLNKLRVDLFNKFIDKFESDGKTYENSKKLYESTAKYINNITGRGELGKLKKFAPLFNALFFSPRLMAARMNMLNPLYFATLPTELKKQYGKDMGTAFSLLSVVLTLFALYGKTQDDDDEDKITVESDPRSTDFARVKQGDTRWDFFGGFQPYIRAASQFGFGERKKATTGEIVELDGRAPGTARTDVVLGFFRNKLAPVPSMIVDFSTGKNAIGEKVEWKDELLSNVIPLSFQSIYEGYEKQGPKAIATVGLPAVFGIGVSTYGERKDEVPEKITYEGRNIKLTDEQIEDFQKIFDEKSAQKLEKLRNMSDYKNSDKILRGELEQLVKNKAYLESKKLLGIKYRREFLIQPKESESRERERVKRRFGID